MGITYIPEEKLFKLDTPNTTYCIGIIDEEGFLGHAYYGRRIDNIRGVSALMRIYENPMTPQVNARDRLSFLDSFPTEYSAHGVGDYRESSVRVRSAEGHSAVLLTYE
ncbi:MAG: alpha-galactosidase, partial [Acetatifactor sp.]|nr:alpha-galactosidase [Acetatifactor sp.]